MNCEATHAVSRDELERLVDEVQAEHRGKQKKRRRAEPLRRNRYRGMKPKARAKKYGGCEYVGTGGSATRKLSSSELAEFRERIQRVIDPASLPAETRSATRRAIV
jgi:hypothetical protein